MAQGIMNPILSAAQLQAEEYKKAAEENKAVAVAQQQQIATESDTINQALERQLTSSQIIADQQRAADLRVEQNILQLHELAGGKEQLSKLIVSATEKTDRVEQKLQKIDKINNAEYTGLDFIDDPIRSFMKSGLEEEVARDMYSLDVTTKNIANFHALTETIVSTQNKLKTTLNQQMISALADKSAADAAIASSKERLENIRLNATAVSNVMKASAGQLDAALKSYEVYNTEEARKRADEMHAKSMKQLEISIAASERAEESHEMKITRINTQAAIIQTAQVKMNVPVTPFEQLKANLSHGPLTDQYKHLLVVGASGDSIIATNPADTRENYAMIDPTGSADTPVTALLREIDTRYSAVLDNIRKKGIKLSADQAKEKYNEVAHAQMTVYSSNIKDGDTANPLHAPAFSILAESEAVKREPLYNRWLKPLEMKETKPSFIVEQSVEAIRNGKLTVDEAALGINTIFKATVGYNNTTKMFARAGFKVQDSYNTEIKAPGHIAAGFLPFVGIQAAAVDNLFGTSLLSTNHKVDLTKYDQVRALLIKYMAGPAASKGE